MAKRAGPKSDESRVFVDDEEIAKTQGDKLRHPPQSSCEGRGGVLDEGGGLFAVILQDVVLNNLYVAHMDDASYKMHNDWAIALHNLNRDVGNLVFVVVMHNMHLKHAAEQLRTVLLRPEIKVS